MQVVKRILKEVIIAFLIMGIILLIGFLLFRNHFGFFTSSVPNAVVYVPINDSDYGVTGSLEDAKDPPKTYEATPSSLRTMTEERRVSTGAPNPFVSSDNPDSDLPSEVVTIANELTSKNDRRDSGEAVQ